VRNNRPIIILIATVLLSIGFGVLATWGNYNYVINNPGVNDFTPRWAGSRIFMTEGRSPYSQQTTREIQIVAYGRVAQEGENQLYFFYPLNIFFLYAPFSLINNHDWARAIWMTVLEIGVVMITIISLNLGDEKKALPIVIRFFVIIFSLTWFFSVLAVLDANLAVICTLALVGFFLAIDRNLDILAGFLLSIAIFKPQIAVLMVIIGLLWAISKRRWLILWSFIGSSAVFIALATLLSPDWFMQFLRQIFPYLEELQLTNTSTILVDWLPGIGKQLAWLLTGIMIILIIIEWRAVLGKGNRWLLWTANLTLVLTILVGIPSSIINYILLLPSVIFIFSILGSRWGKFGRFALILGFIVLSMFFWFIFLVNNSWELTVNQNPGLYFLTPFVVLIGLYWIRWWAISKPDLPMQNLSERIID